MDNSTCMVNVTKEEEEKKNKQYMCIATIYLTNRQNPNTKREKKKKERKYCIWLFLIKKGQTNKTHTQ